MAESCKTEGCLCRSGAGINMTFKTIMELPKQLLIITLKPDGFLGFWTCVLSSSADLEAEAFVLSCLVFWRKICSFMFLAKRTVEYRS